MADLFNRKAVEKGNEIGLQNSWHVDVSIKADKERHHEKSKIVSGPTGRIPSPALGLFD